MRRLLFFGFLAALLIFGVMRFFGGSDLPAELVEDKEFVKKANAVILARSRCRRMGNWRDDWSAPLLTDRFKRRF